MVKQFQTKIKCETYNKNQAENSKHNFLSSFQLSPDRGGHYQHQITDRFSYSYHMIQPRYKVQCIQT